MKMATTAIAVILLYIKRNIATAQITILVLVFDELCNTYTL